MSSDQKESVLELLRRDVDAGEYERIRQEWKTHSIAEDQRDIAGLMSTLTPDCVYEIVNTGDVWHGHGGATAFYQTLLSAFPDITFNLINIVIGPQGVAEEAIARATHQHDWLRFRASGKPVTFNVMIFFPWDRTRGKFKGERIFLDSKAVTNP